MFEIGLICILCIIIAYLGIRLSNAKIELTDLRIKYDASQDALDTIIETRKNERIDKNVRTDGSN